MEISLGLEGNLVCHITHWIFTAHTKSPTMVVQLIIIES